MSLRVGVLGSTRGTALLGILEAIRSGSLDAEIVLIASDKGDAGILQKAEAYDIPGRHMSPKGMTREEFDASISQAFRDAGAELILLIGYMRILSKGFVDDWRGRLLNVHPSLLPAFGGLMNRSVHQAVLKAGVPETGCTIHQVTEEVDAGEVVLQKRCLVLPGDTAESLKDRVQALEQQAFVDVLREWRRA